MTSSLTVCSPMELFLKNQLNFYYAHQLYKIIKTHQQPCHRLSDCKRLRRQLWQHRQHLGQRGLNHFRLLLCLLKELVCHFLLQVKLGHRRILWSKRTWAQELAAQAGNNLEPAFIFTSIIFCYCFVTSKTCKWASWSMNSATTDFVRCISHVKIDRVVSIYFPNTVKKSLRKSVLSNQQVLLCQTLMWASPVICFELDGSFAFCEWMNERKLLLPSVGRIPFVVRQILCTGCIPILFLMMRWFFVIYSNSSIDKKYVLNSCSLVITIS